MLPAETGRMLIEHYIEDLPQAEIAARRKLKTGTVAVRLQRGKLTLQKLLSSKLRGDASAYSLIYNTSRIAASSSAKAFFETLNSSATIIVS